MRILFLLFLVLSGCKTYQVLSPDTWYPSPAPYARQFYEDCKVYRNGCNTAFKFKVVIVRDLSVGWDQYDSGYCEYLTNKIYLDYGTWVNSSPTEKRILLYHELGHCALNKWLHRDGQISGLTVQNPNSTKIPKSIMNGKGDLPTESQFLNNQEYYLNELFN